VTTGGGRKIWVDISGPENGFPVLRHAGSPGSRRLFGPAVDCANACGFRLISYDRPGYGDTPPRSNRLIADGVVETLAIANELGFSELAVWGFSGGGPYALACAALLPEVVVGCCVFSSFAPYAAEGLDFATGCSDEYRREIELFFEDPQVARDHFRVEAHDLFAASSTAEGWLERWGAAAETDAAHSRQLAEYLALVQQDCLSRSDQGWWDDWAAVLTPWGFDPVEIDSPVQLWHGQSDEAVSPAHGHWLADRISGIDAHFPEGDDHTNIEEYHQREAYDWLRQLL
jgi:pimeloyl-ACP methyl ester carboxylesterase